MIPTIHEIDGLTITTGNLCKRFNREWIFKDLSFQFKAGQVYAVTGPNGSGKSTLLQILWGQLPQTSGTLNYRLGNTPIPAEEIYNHVSIAAPYMDLIEEFTIAEQVKFHFQLKAMRAGSSPEHFLETVYLKEFRNKKIGNFSSGMKQRLKLGLALYTRAEVIFLDEPGTNLDEQATEWYQEQLKRLPASTMIFIASNNPREYPKNAKVVDLMGYKLYK